MDFEWNIDRLSQGESVKSQVNMQKQIFYRFPFYYSLSIQFLKKKKRKKHL